MNNSSWFEKFKERKIGQTLAVYLGSSWVFIEAINFLIDKYDLNAAILDVPILLVIFGLPAILIHAWFQQKFTRKAIILQSINGIIALSIIIFTLANPGRLNPTQLRLLKFKDDQKKLAEAIQSIAILPFDNYTGNDEYEYFVSGMHSSLIGDLGQVGALRVISKTSSRVFKGTAMSIPEIASELGVDAVVEASVSCIEGDSVCIQIRLVSAFPEEQQLWVQDYYEDKSQILNLYHRVTKQISEEINIMLTPQEENLLAETRTVDPAAYDLFMKGQFYNDQMSKDALEKAAQYFNLAIEKEPEWAPPYWGLCSVVARQMQMGFVSPSIAIPKNTEYLNKALELDSNSSEAHGHIAATAAWTEWNWEKAEKEYLKSIELNPNYAMSRNFYAHVLTILRRTDEALHHAKIAQELDPLNPFTLGLYAMVLIEAGECEAALTHIEKGLSIEPDHFFTRPKLRWAYECLGDYEKVFELWKQRNYALWEEYKLTEFYEKVFHEHGWLAVQEEALKFYEEVLVKDGRMNPGGQLYKYFVLGNYNKILDHYGKMYEYHNPNLPYISARSTYNKMKDNPRYIELLKKMNLPVGELSE